MVGEAQRRGCYFYSRFTHDIIEAAIEKSHRVLIHHRPIVLAMDRTRDATHLEDVHEVGAEADLNHKINCLKIEILKCYAIEEDIVGQQLLPPNVDRVLRQVKRFAQRDVAGGQLNLRGKRLFRAR
jgi:hypothetical protein